MRFFTHNRAGRRFLLLLLPTALFLGACAETEPEVDPDVEARRTERAGRTIEIVHPEWSSEIASANLFRAVLQERLGYRVELRAVGVEQMWEEVAEGSADVLLGAWLPVTHEKYYDEYENQLVDLGPNLEGARIGLVVPTHTPGRQTEGTGRAGRPLVTTDSIPDLAEFPERFGRRVVGIESGAGVVQRALEALEHYGLSSFRVSDSNEQQMITELSGAVNRNQWIVLTGWSPHWMWERYSLTFLDDPDGIFGGEEQIHTMVREGFEEDEPDAYEVLDRVRYAPRDLERLMLWIYDDETGDDYGQALRWIETNSETVDRWVDGVE